MSVHCFDKALEIEPNKVAYMLKRLPSLLKMEQFDEYIKTIDRIIKLDTDAICIADQPLGLQQALHKQLEALQGLKNTVQRLKSSIALHKVFPALRVLNEFMEAYKNNNLDIAKQKWSEAIALGAQWDQLPVGYKISFNIERSWQEDASGILIAIALEGKEAYVRELIALAEGGDIFFPLARALDYISTKDEALIEKLTPEMRPIVDEVIKKLRPS